MFQKNLKQQTEFNNITLCLRGGNCLTRVIPNAL